MIKNHEIFQQLGQQNVETAIKMFGEWSKGWRAVSAEMGDFTRRSREDGIATVEKLFRAKSVDQALGIQSDFTARTLDSYFHNLSKISGIYAHSRIPTSRLSRFCTILRDRNNRLHICVSVRTA